MVGCPGVEPGYSLLMSFSLGHGKRLDVGDIGVPAEVLPGYDHGPIDLGGWFGADRADLPLELEIGSGKGTFLVQQATRMPEVNYLGIEWAKAFWRYAADRCRRHALANVRLVRDDAAGFVRQYVGNEVFRQVHIYFPDPWPKKRHHKRRIIQAGFLGELHRVLTPACENDASAGIVRLATDHADYFQWMQAEAAKVEDLFDRQPFVRPESAGQGELVGTNFERKYRREGRPFEGMVLLKR